jgi:di/tricarboxylate transporter
MIGEYIPDTWNPWITLAVLGSIVFMLIIRKKTGPDLVMTGGLVLLLIFGVVDVADATAGFAQRPILMIAGLFIIAAALQETGGIELIGHKLLGKPDTLSKAQLRMMIPVAAMSAFMNTTPIVAMYLPMVTNWAKRLKIPASKLFMPLSFAGILGGQGTMIGTGSNLIIMGLFIEWWQNPPTWATDLGVSAPSSAVSMWGAAWIGVPVAICGILFIVLTSKWLLPVRTSQEPTHDGVRKRGITMAIEEGSSMVGKTIEKADLRNLPGLYLSSYIRKEKRHEADTNFTLEQDDKLVFVGDLSSVVELRKTRELIPAEDDIGGRAVSRKMIEAVVSSSSPLIGMSVKESEFRTRYKAVILSVHRNGKYLDTKIGPIVIQPGDTLLLESGGEFLKYWKDSSDFYVVSEIKDSRPPLRDKAKRSLGILAILILFLTFGGVDRVTAIWLCGLAMILTGCISGPKARQAINLQVLIVIGAAMGIGKAVQLSGLAEMSSTTLLTFASNMHLGEYGTLFLIFIMTSFGAQLMTNFGAAVIMFPIVISAAHGLDVSPYPFVFTMMAAAGCNFITPITYQTNLMVFGPGGYTFTDFPRLGIPLTLLVAVLATIIAPQVFPFLPLG